MAIACTDEEKRTDRVCTYVAGREDEFVRRLRVVNDLRAAIRHRELQVWYQPKACLEKGDICGVKPGYLTLEITESSIMEDLGRSLLVLECLRDVGVRISIDDFGTGHSSLAQLKVDKSFIFGICRDREDEAIVRATIELAHSLGLEVVAEGVEVAQGYFLSKPVPAETLTKWLLRYTPTVYPDRRKSE